MVSLASDNDLALGDGMGGLGDRMKQVGDGMGQVKDGMGELGTSCAGALQGRDNAMRTWRHYFAVRGYLLHPLDNMR